MYAASVGHGVTETTVTAMAAAGAAYEVNLNGVVDQYGVVGLAVGSGNVTTVVVTAQDGETRLTYTVTVLAGRRTERQSKIREVTVPYVSQALRNAPAQLVSAEGQTFQIGKAAQLRRYRPGQLVFTEGQRF